MTGRKKQLYIALILLGGVALFVDRVFLSAAGPQAALATTNPQSSSVKRQAPIAQASPIPELHFPRQLPALDMNAALRDWFAPPARPENQDEQGVSTDNGAPGEKQLVEPILSPKEAFAARHRLEGIVLQKGLKMAIVDGVWLRIGQEFGDCALRELSGRTAVFTCADGDVELTLFQNLLQDPP